MRPALLMSVDEYLHSRFRPDCDYVEGEIRERSLGERDHATVQLAFCVIFHGNREGWNIVPLPEQRVQVSDARFRVPDVCVVRKSDPREQVVRTPPLICIEVLSPDDTLTQLQERVDDYVSLGIEHIWVVDPATRHAYTAGPAGFIEVGTGEFTVPGTPIRVALADLFAELDGDIQ